MLTVRVPIALLDRADALIDAIAADSDIATALGARVTRSSVLRLMLAEGRQGAGTAVSLSGFCDLDAALNARALHRPQVVLQLPLPQHQHPNERERTSKNKQAPQDEWVSPQEP